MDHYELLGIVRDVPARFAPAWQGERREAATGTVRLCPCHLLDGRGRDSVTARWHRLGENTNALHPTGLGIAAGLAELAWIGSMTTALVAIGLLPSPVEGEAFIVTLARAAIAAGPGEGVAVVQPDLLTMSYIRPRPPAEPRPLDEKAIREACAATAKLLARLPGTAGEVGARHLNALDRQDASGAQPDTGGRCEERAAVGR